MSNHRYCAGSFAAGETLTRTGVGLGLLLIAFVAWAADAEPGPASPDWVQLGLGLFGGLALFLAGLQLLSEGMKKAAGQALKTVLAQLTTNRFMGAVTGAFVTGILNSSTVTNSRSFTPISRAQLSATSSRSRSSGWCASAVTEKRAPISRANP